MTSVKFKIESGVQLLARLIKKPEIGNFYPKIFQSGPKPGDVVEVFGDSSCFLIDLICEAILPAKLGGAEAQVLFFNSDGNFSYDHLIYVLRTKILTRINYCSSENMTKHTHIYSKTDLEKLLNETLANFYMLDIYDVTQFYTTIQNLENILMEHSNISFIICDTLTAFYWSEQSFKITKMDLYVKNLLCTFQKITKEHKIIFIFTRPEYFSSNRESIDNLEPCCEYPTLECLNYRIQLLNVNNMGNHQVNVRTFNMAFKTYFNVINGEIKWI